ncbi:MAG: glycerophosphodiester phosphodiesterase family protein [Candidatus Sumerlaeota bacterium]|nr:glycerophosphodiester phosphodiesterase family protein [Candidatus Sumerlaeota bacterium]
MKSINLHVSHACYTVALVALILVNQAVLPAVISVGHRGNSSFAPENTVAAINATRGKADWVEFDVHKSLDGALVVIHDDTVNRTTTGTGSVASMTLSQLRALDAGVKFDPYFTSEKIPTFDEAVNAALANGLIPLIERKASSVTPADLSNALAALGATTGVVVQSFDWNFIRDLHTLNPVIRIGVLGSGTLTTASISQAKSDGSEMIAWEQGGVTPSVVAAVHSYGLNMLAWTVDGLAIPTVYDRGVDGIISNDPGLVSEVAGRNPYVPGSLETDLIAYWKLDDNLTSVAPEFVADSKGANTGAVAGAPAWATPPTAMFGGAVLLDGVDDAVVMPSNPVLDIGVNGCGISLWVKLDQLPSEQSVSYAGIYDSVEDSYVLYVDKSNNELRVKFTAGADAVRPGIPSSSLEKTRWHHIAAVYNGNWGALAGESRIYFDGKLKDNHAGKDGSSSPYKGMTGLVKPGQIGAIGRNGSQASGYFKWRVDDVALWKRPLSMPEIQQIYAAGLTGQPLSALLPITRVGDWTLY